MKKIVGFIALLAIVAVGAKFFLEYRYKQELDKGVQGASLFAEISYKDLNVGFDGAIELLDLRVTPNGSFDTFKVASVKLSGMDFMFHFNGKSRLQKGEFPKFLNVNIDQFSFPASLYEKEVAEDECKSLAGTLLYSVAGFDEIVMDADLMFDMADPFAATFTMTGNDQISRSGFNMKFNARQMSFGQLSGGALPVQSVRYDYFLEEEAANTMLDHCAKKFKITRDDFLTKVVKSGKFMSNSFTMEFGDAASKAMADFLQGGKELVVRSTPSERLKNLSFASKSSLPQIVRMLNLSVSLDGSSVPIRTFKSQGGEDEIAALEAEGRDEGGFKRRDLNDLLNNPDGTVQERVRPKLAKKKGQSQYEAGTLNRARDYINKDIRVTRTKDRSPIEGYLLSVEDQILSVEIYRHGGVMTYTVPYKDISKLEIKKRR